MTRWGKSLRKQWFNFRLRWFRSRRKIIVSMTTISSRIEKLHPTIDSILQQTCAPDEIYLWLSEEPYLLDEGIKREKIPSWLVELEALGKVRIHYTRNTGPYRKLLPILERYFDSDHALITADDDIIYKRDWIESLVSAHFKYPNRVIGHRVYLMRHSAACLRPYICWKKLWEGRKLTNHERKAVNQGMLLFPTGKDGILYFSRFFNREVFDSA